MLGAEAAGLAALGWVVSPVINKFVSKGISYLGSDITKGLEDLETTLLPQFQLTIQAAQNSPDKDNLNKLAKWLARLKNAYYDAEAILHELEYEDLKSMVKADEKKLGEGSSSSSHPSLKPSPVTKTLSCCNLWQLFTREVSEKISNLSPQKKKLLDNLYNLKKIAEEAKVFRELLNINSKNVNDAPASNRNSVTTGILTHKVFGRDDVRDQIINILLHEQGESRLTQSYSVVAIIGIGGAGKTTLAQYVYNDERVKEKFGVRIWLCSSENKDVNELTKVMITAVTKKESPNLLGLDNLQNELIETLPESESILLVLDDVWYYEKTEKRDQQDQEWDNLLAPFVSIGRRCKIVVTSRKTLFPNALSRAKVIPIMLDELAHDDFKSLFRYYAMDDLKVDPRLCKIGDDIAAKMIRSPLAAKVVGNQLRKRPQDSFWESTLNSDLLSSTRKVLLWSYQHWDVQLQRCFMFCGVFPKGTYFKDANEMVEYWLALDFIRSSNDNTTGDNIGIEYFNMMVENSIFQLVDGKYYMHDLFCDLAENLSTGDCFRITNSQKTIPSTILYAFIRVNNKNLKNILSSICNLRNLRALILDIRLNIIEDLSEILPKVFTEFKNLRVLTIWSFFSFKELRSVVGDLRNLRYLTYLNLFSSSIEELPDSVSELYHLQFLLLPSSIKSLPPKLTDLIKLRNIVMHMNHNIVRTLPPIPYLGKLTSLRSLSEFHVRKEEGYQLSQLGSLREIAGSLRIINLENVRQKDEAIKAKLFEKLKLKRLELVWDHSSENSFDSEVIEALQPTEGLEYLSIEGYGSSRHPSWLLKGSFVKNIKYLKFYNCSTITNLPPNFHQLCPNLTEFRVSACPSLIFVCENELQLNDNVGTIGECSWIHQHNLNLKIVLLHEVPSFKKTDPEQNCGDNLKIIEHAAEDSDPDLTTDVQSAWWQCHQQRMNFIFRCKTEANKLILLSKLHILFISFCCITDGALSNCLRGMITLKELYLEGIMTITTLPPVEILKHLRSLRVLTIKYCWCLSSMGGLLGLPNLEKLTLDSCWSLTLGLDELPFLVRVGLVPPLQQSNITEPPPTSVQQGRSYSLIGGSRDPP